MEIKTGPDAPVQSYCSACWRDRILTTNGKCRTCGTDLVKRHWKTSIKKLEIIIEMGNVMPLEIKGRMYVIPKKTIEKFKQLENYPDKIKFIEDVKKTCKNYKI